MMFSERLKIAYYSILSPESRARIAWKFIKNQIDESVENFIRYNGDDPHNLRVYLDAENSTVNYFYENECRGHFWFANMTEIPDSKNHAALDAFQAELMKLFAESYKMPLNNGVTYIVR